MTFFKEVKKWLLTSAASFFEDMVKSLWGIACVASHKLSGDGTDENTRACLDLEAHRAAEKQINDMKLRALAKLRAWRKKKKMKAQKRNVPPLDRRSEEPFFKRDKSSTEKEMKIEELKHELQEKEKLISSLQSQLTKAEIAAQAVTEETIASLQKRVVELENEKGALLLSSVELEELKSEDEKLSSQITLLKAQNQTEEADSEVCEISMIDITIPKKSGSSTEKSGQDVLENTFSQNHNELSVLLLEMKEAQEEIAFLKSQLQGEMSAGHHEIPDQKEVQQMEGEGIPPVGMQVFLENAAQDFPLVPNEESSVPVVEKEDQASTELQNTTFEEISLNDTGIEMKSSEQGDAEKSPSAVPDVRQCHQDEVERLKSQILELQTSFRKAEEIYEKDSEEKAQEISSLTQLIEEFKKNAEDTSSVLTALFKERDQLLSQVKELNVLSELRAQVKQLETNLAEAERQRRSDSERQTTQHNLFTEQIDSLSIEAKSKDVTIDALQKELDDVQLQFSEQSTLMQSLQNQLQKKEREVLEGAERVRGISSKMEELSQALSQKELEIAQMDQLLLEKKRDVETLQQTIEEKDQQVRAISFSMTEKMVQLNEEKCSLGVEIKTLKEQLNLLSRAEEAKKEQVQEGTEVISGLQHNYDESSPAWLVNKELQRELDCLKKESELRKKQLKAALISRKELLQRVSTLEEELAKVTHECRKKIPLNESERRETEEDKENKEDSEICVPSKCQEVEISLKQTISEKEMELQHVREDLEENMAAEAQLQAVVQQMNQNLQDKANEIDLLQAEITDNQAVIQNLTTGAKDAGAGDCTTPIKETAVSSPPAAGSGEHWKPELEEKILELEKEKEILQKKLQGALTSHKAILKKALENERQLREELKQEKDDYNRLQEQFDEQSKEKEDIEDQLKQLQIQLRESIDGKRPGTDQQELHFPAQCFFQATDQYPTQPALESDLCPRMPFQHRGASTLQGHTCIAQIKAYLKEIEAEKDELKFKVSSTTSELTTKSEEVFELKEQINQQIFQIQSLKAASHEREAHTQSLKQKLESSQLEIAGLEHLRALQPKLDELQNLISEKEEEVSHLSGQLSEKETNLTKVQTEVIEQEDLIKALHTQLEMQAKEHEGRVKQLQVEICELKQKPEVTAEENKAKQLTQRKLQAALISRKEALKTNKGLQEELSLARDTIESLTKSLADVESQVSTQNKEKDTLLGKLALLQEERDRLITEMDRYLLENQNLSGSCESLKLALEGLTEDKENLVKEIECLRCSKIAESTECQEKHTELQKEHEILLQAEEKHLKEKNMQEKLDTLHREKVHLEETLGKIHITLNKKDKEAKQLQEKLDNTVAQLAAFTKSMSSLQDNQDRVIDEVKKWERKFGDAIQTKEEEIRLKEENCNVLRDQLRQMSILMEELKINISRLEHDKQILEFKAQAEVQHQQKVCDVLQGENKELFSQLEETQHLYYNSQNELTKLESEVQILRDQSTDLKNSLEKYKEHKETLEGVIKQQEADIQNCKFKYEQLETDLQASRELTSRLHEEINMKEQKIISLLSGKEQAIHVAVTELHQQYDKEIKELENLLSHEEGNKKSVDKTNQLMETLKSIKKENIHQKVQLDSFVKSMSSLQNDQDRIVIDYQQLEERHLSIILEKDQLIQEAAAENNKLKEEIRGLRSHMDDLNSENAKLDAELIQYRKDLNQVIAIKDSQQRQLLEEELGHECAKLKENLKESKEAKKVLQMSSDALQKEKESLCKEIENLKISISQLNRQEEDNLGMYHAHLKVKEEEVQRLSAILSSSQKTITELEEELVRVQKEATRKVGEIERHISIVLEKDQLIQEAAAENNKLKEEIQGLKSHMDELNSENAKLDAELIQYREDLNQVTAIKDSQQKQLLEEELRRECAKLEENLKESKEAKKVLQMSSDTLQKENESLCKEIENLKISISQLNRQEEDNLGMYHAYLKVKEEEVQRLSAILSSSQKTITELEEELVRVQKEATRKVGEIEDKLKKELKLLHHDAGIMRNEAETAQERVAELSRYLVEMEQKLLVVTKENKDLTAQIQSFGMSMNSLQNSRDHAKEELDELKRKCDASLKELAQLREQKGLLHRESDALLSQTAVHLNSTEENSLSGLEKLNQQLISKDEQLLHLSSQLEDSYNQVQFFSKAMASLQNERDHLWSELEKSRKSEDGKQRSAAQSVSSPAEVQTLKTAMSSLQNDRDRLLKELENLQQQYLKINQEITELRPLKAQLQEYQDKTKRFQMMQEELWQENLFWQHELHQLSLFARMEKNSWETHERRMQEQYLMAISDRDQQLSHLQGLLREFRPPSQTQTHKEQYQRQASPQTSTSVEGSQNLVYETDLLRTQLNDSLKEIHEKELRIQQMNSKFSQILEEKNTLSIQLSDTSQSLRETQQYYSDLFNHCAFLEKQVQELQVRLRRVDVAPRAPQEKNGVHRKSDPEEAREPQPSFSETQQQLCNTKQEVNKLRKLLEEERYQRTAAENALSLAEEHIRRLERYEWDSLTPVALRSGHC